MPTAPPPPDRTQPPRPAPIRFRPLPEPDEHRLAAGVPVYLLNHGELEVLDLQLLFRAGLRREPATGVADYTARLLSHGTARHTAAQLADALDAYGAEFAVEAGQEVLSLRLQCLAPYAEPAIALLAEILYEAAFPPDEFELMQRRGIEQLQVEARRTTYHARRAFRHRLFGPEHPYGSHMGPEELSGLHREQLVRYHAELLRPGPFAAIAAGRFATTELLAVLDEHFGAAPPPAADAPPPLPAPRDEAGRHHAELPGNLQCTLRVGHRGLPRQHPDHYAIRFATLLLGGYFGSRLMKAIREEKGYTYGIAAQWMALKEDGYFLIGADVGNEYVEATLSEIRGQMERLQAAPVPTAELETARRYFLGRLTARHETPFQLASILRTQLVMGLPPDEEARAFAAVEGMTAEAIQEAARAHLHPGQLLEVVAGSAAESA